MVFPKNIKFDIKFHFVFVVPIHKKSLFDKVKAFFNKKQLTGPDFQYDIFVFFYDTMQ